MIAWSWKDVVMVWFSVGLSARKRLKRRGDLNVTSGGFVDDFGYLIFQQNSKKVFEDSIKLLILKF